MGKEENEDISHSQVEKAPPRSSDEQPPPSYEDIASSLNSLREGDPQDIISVPMVSSVEKKSFKSFFTGKSEVVSSVHARRMTREHYLKHYAKDADGKYIGTGKPAVDAGLVFVPRKSSPQELLEQIKKVAFGKEHHVADFGGVFPGASGTGGGFAG